MPLIIAEAGVNHNGSLELALRLCEAARTAGADVVKFQTFKTEKVLTRRAAMADYQAAQLGDGKTQFEMVKELELRYQDFKAIKAKCDELGIRFVRGPTAVVRSAADGKALPPSAVEVVLGSQSASVAYPVFVEVTTRKVLDRDEFRRLCDAAKTRERIVNALER